MLFQLAYQKEGKTRYIYWHILWMQDIAGSIRISCEIKKSLVLFAYLMEATYHMFYRSNKMLQLISYMEVKYIWHHSHVIRKQNVAGSIRMLWEQHSLVLFAYVRKAK